MSKIFELFGYRLDAWTKESELNRSKAWCPFMDAQCDGGGNRYSSDIRLIKDHPLRSYFPGKTTVPSGICSLRIRAGEEPWIVCPRRLLSLKSETSNHQKYVRDKLYEFLNYENGRYLKVWSEVKIKESIIRSDKKQITFDYTFDYVLTGISRKKISEISELLGKSEGQVKKTAENNGYTISSRNGVLWIEDFPSDPITIIEIMTSSTSGGNKKNRTQISMAFEDAILNKDNHNGPGINYRQVWARMVSQLIVKSQVGNNWGGKTLWILQDVLAEYISNSTALNLWNYLSAFPDEVNILTYGYGDINSREAKPIEELNSFNSYSGPINGPNQEENDGGFVDIIKVGSIPPKKTLWKSLFLKQCCSSILVE